MLFYALFRLTRTVILFQFSDKYVNSTLYKKRKVKFSLFKWCRIYIVIAKLFL